MFFRKILLGLIFSIFLLGSTHAENNLIIEVEGEANGRIEITLLSDLAPLHVERIKTLVNSGSYNGIVFHRVIEGFTAQTGDVQFGNKLALQTDLVGRGGSSMPDLPSEFSDMPFIEGTVGMARSQDPNSANSQFFIMLEDSMHLNNQYTVWGKVLKGMDVVDNIKKGDQLDNGKVDNPDFIKTIKNV